MPFRNTPIQRKLVAIILLTSSVVLLVTCTAFLIYDVIVFRRAIVERVSTLAEITAANSTAALAFENQDDARENLAALKPERRIVAASLYDRDGKLFAKYPANLPDSAFPAAPGKDGHYFEDAHLTAFQPVVQNDKRLGTLYLKSDLGAIYARFRLYGIVVVLAVIGSFLLAYPISQMLQRQISEPILSLAKTAKAVSDHRDYSVRSPKLGKDELGLLTDTFNHMLTQIQEQDGALRESEARARAVLNSALSAVVVIDAEGKITDWNARAEKMFDWARQEALGRELAEIIIPPRYREAHRRGLKRFQAAGEGPVLNQLIELSALRRDGSEFPVELSISPMKTGGVTTFCGFITDITERKREEEVRARLVAIVESSDDAIISKTMEGFITSWNPGAEKLFGFAAEEMIGQPMLRIIPNDRAKEEPEILARIARGEATSHYETVRLGKDGRRIDVSVSISPLRDDQGKIIGASTIARDNTERKLAESKIQDQLSRLSLLHQLTRGIGERQDLQSIFQIILRSLEDNLPIDFGCLCLYDPAAEILTVASIGPRSRMVGIQPAMFEGASLPTDENGLSRCVRGQLVYEPDISTAPFAFPQRLANGGLRSFVAAPLLVEGAVFGVLVAARRTVNAFSSADCEFLRQLSEHIALAAHQARLYGALQQAYNDLRQTQHTVMQQERLRALGQMASGIAHDINNAISPVALYTEALLERDTSLSEKARDYLRTIQRAIEDVAQTVSRMREFYRQREPQLVLAPIDLNRLTQQVLDLTRARWRDLSQGQGIAITLQTEFASDLPEIMGAEGEIRDALTNLVFNAVDAMPEGGTLTLRTRAVASQELHNGPASPLFVQVEVADTGVGMDEETKRRCLEPFFTTKGERGTGLGLAMVYGMVQRHSADIEIDSQPGKGTTMRLTFAVSIPVMTSEVRPATATAPMRRLRILVVDDDPLLTKSLRDILEGDGHVVTTTDGGQEGIEAFLAAVKSGELFGAVITDLGMPYVDGRKVAAAIKAASPATPVIMLTGWGQRLLAENDVPPHVDRLLNKPPKLHELRAALIELTA